MEAEYLSTVEVARKIGVKPQTVRKWRVLGCGPKYVRLGNKLKGRALYQRDMVEQWLADRTFSHTASETAQRNATNG